MQPPESSKLPLQLIRHAAFFWQFCMQPPPAHVNVARAGHVCVHLPPAQSRKHSRPGAQV